MDQTPDMVREMVTVPDLAGAQTVEAVLEAPAVDQVPGGLSLLAAGGPAIWAIAALSAVTVALILWKLWRFSLTGVWRRAQAEAAVAAWLTGTDPDTLSAARAGAGVCTRFMAQTISALKTPGVDEARAREETGRVAKRLLAEARSGLRALELIATIAPLLGLLGTVLGMITAFQALQASGARADPAALAGGIWEALLTTAAGMAVAIPASVALTWFESVIDRLQSDMEDMATRLFTRPVRPALIHAAE